MIVLWQQGNEQAFDFFYETYLMLLISIAFDKTGDRDVAEELVQETFINFYEHKKSLKAHVSVKAFLYVTLKNKIIDYYRRELLHRRYSDYVEQHAKVETLSPLAYVETKELESILQNAIDQLPPQCQNVFKLSREQHLSDKQIATALNISVNTVEQHKRKALRILRGSLGGLFYIAAFTNWFIVR